MRRTHPASALRCALTLSTGLLLLACSGASVHGGEVRPLGSAGMSKVRSLLTTQCRAPGGASALEVQRGSQVELWAGGSQAEPARVLVERIPDHQLLQVHRSFPVAGGVLYEVELHPEHGAPLLQRYTLRDATGPDGAQGTLEVLRGFILHPAKASSGGRVVLRCQLVAPARIAPAGG